jgi:nucleotide-binding universal stress UspA family protein
MNHSPGRPVVVGVDGSDAARLAVGWAADEAARRPAPLRLVAAFGWTERQAASYLGPQDRAVLLEKSRRALSAAGATVAERQPDLPCSQDLRMGHPIGVLADEARRAQLLVVGERGMSRLEGLLVGSVAAAMAVHAACPVVVVRGPADAAGPVLLGVDGSPVSEPAIEFAYRAAADRGLPLVAVHTWQEEFAAPALTSRMYRREDQAYEQQLLAQRLAGWAEKYPDVVVTRIVGHGDAVRRLVELSRRAQLVVVGSHGRGELAGFFLGSVSNALVYKAGCPVAIVRPTTEEQAEELDRA